MESPSSYSLTCVLLYVLEPVLAPFCVRLEKENISEKGPDQTGLSYFFLINNGFGRAQRTEWCHSSAWSWVSKPRGQTTKQHSSDGSAAVPVPRLRSAFVLPFDR